ncbi:MAG: hypothetical protein MUE51_16420 [Thermoleophilia bacterium]|nr:hypothetical protein [Thermoleophilia bacterium]
MLSLGASGGTLTAVPGRAGVFDLRLTGVAGATTLQPGQGTLAVLAPGSLPSRWAALGFAADPPTAALALSGRPASRDVALLTLSRPRAVSGGLVFRVRTAKPRTTGALRDLSRRADRPVAGAFGSASLVLDRAGSIPPNTIVESVSMAFSVTGFPAGSGFVALTLDSGAKFQAGLPSAGSPLIIASTRGSLAGTSNFEGGAQGSVLQGSVDVPVTQAMVQQPNLTFTGTLLAPAGVTVTAQVGGTTVTVPSGRFSITFPG